MTDIDKLIHEPARLWILMYLYPVEKADFTFLRNETGMTQGNLSSHLSKLEKAGYIIQEKSFSGKRPLTLVSMSSEGRQLYAEYIRRMKDLYTDLARVI